MKVVLFCGGLGLRIRDAAPQIPKPMMPVGGQPILLQIMKYYAHFGHMDFILCLGYKSQTIIDFFRTSAGGVFLGSSTSSGAVVGTLVEDNCVWNVTLVETGLHASIGERLLSVKKYVADDEMFLANYSDVLTDAPLPLLVDNLRRRRKIASFLCVRPTYTSHVVTLKDDGQVVAAIQDIRQQEIWINGGYFAFRREIFDYLRPGEDLVEAPFRRLIKDEQLLAFRWEGFWVPMDTFKDRQVIQALYDEGRRPWAVWEGVTELAPATAGR
jgi:glucose-1-phosphate cytidylyltransferase